MALVKKLNRLDKLRNSEHNEAECTYPIFTDCNGNKILQMDTYGSISREFKGKVSQSIQFNEESAKELLNLISTELLDQKLDKL